MQRSRAIAAVLAASALVPLTQQVAEAATTPVVDIPVALRALNQPAPAQGPTIPEVSAVELGSEIQSLQRERQIGQVREARERAKERAEKRAEAKRKRLAAKRAAAQPDYVKPTNGRLTSGFGARWGAMHSGIDLANSLGTPIVAAADGEVVEAGPASGFGLWVQIKHDDGSITVYGHMYEFSVSVGQRVKAGEKIAEIGNNGQSTGPHLHFEVWQNGGTKIDPIGWLAEHGVNL